MGFVENVNTLATNLTAEVAAGIDAIGIVASNMPDVVAVGANIADVSAVAANEPAVDTVALNIPAVIIVSDDIASVVTTAANILDVAAVADQIIPNLVEILEADTNAATATTKAGEASGSATAAQLRAWEAEAEKMTADSYATEAEDVFVKVYTSDGDGTFTATNTAEYSSLHWAAKATTLVTTGVIDDTIPQLDRAYSSVKTQELHDAQAIAIANLSGASATFYNNTTQVVPESPTTFLDLSWTNGQASTNSDIFELGVNEVSFKQDGTYNFLNTLTYFRVSDGSAMSVTYELYDADTSTVLGTFVQPIDMIDGTKETVPMNALLIITGASALDPVRMKVRMQASSASGTLELFSFNSILALGSVPVSATITQVDAALGSIYEGLA